MKNSEIIEAVWCAVWSIIAAVCVYATGVIVASYGVNACTFAIAFCAATVVGFVTFIGYEMSEEQQW